MVVCDLEHRCRVTALCMYYKIRPNYDPALKAVLSEFRLTSSSTSLVVVSVSSRYPGVPKFRQVQFSLSFVIVCVQYWNSFDETCFANDGVVVFKSLINRALFLVDQYYLLLLAFPIISCF